MLHTYGFSCWKGEEGWAMWLDRKERKVIEECMLTVMSIPAYEC